MQRGQITHGANQHRKGAPQHKKGAAQHKKGADQHEWANQQLCRGQKNTDGGKSAQVHNPNPNPKP